MSVSAGHTERPDPSETRDDVWHASAVASDDEALLIGIRAGREAELETAIQRYYGPICGFLARLVGEEADDLAQQVFWRLFTRPPDRGGSNLRAWLYRVASRLAYNDLRRRRRLDLAARKMWKDDQNGIPDSACAMLDDTDGDRQLVRAALTRMRHRDAELLALRYGGLSYRQVAQALGLAPGSVGTLLARAERAFENQYRQLAAAGGEQ